MLVKSLMALGRFSLILAVSSNCYAQSWSQSFNSNWQRNDGIVGMTYNLIKWHTTRLNSVDSAYHSQAVYHALENAENGQVVEWFSERSESLGRVMIAMTWPANGNICRRVNHYVRTNNAEKAWAETACRHSNNSQWVFTDK